MVDKLLKLKSFLESVANSGQDAASPVSNSSSTTELAILEQDESNSAFNSSASASVPGQDESGSTATALCPKNIQAFRTITTLLSCIPKASSGLPLNLTKTSNPRPDVVRQELKILLVLATLLIRNHEIVTIAALPEEGDLQPVACSLFDPAKTRLCTTHPAGINEWQLWTTRNSRRTDKSYSYPDSYRLFALPFNQDVSKETLQKTYVTSDVYI